MLPNRKHLGKTYFLQHNCGLHMSIKQCLYAYGETYLVNKKIQFGANLGSILSCVPNQTNVFFFY